MLRSLVAGSLVSVLLAACSGGGDDAAAGGGGASSASTTATGAEGGGGATCTPPSGGPPPSPSPRLDEVWQIATHNSYWVNHGVDDPFASGVQERFVDQILVDHARSVEIDVHRDDANPHEFLVFHTEPGNGLCDTLRECLGVLRAVEHALPDHELFTIALELKQITASNFDATHTIEDLDRVFEEELGDRLYRPRDLLDRCAGPCVPTLGDCANAVGWPDATDLRGRFVVAILGNWDLIGAQATIDWVHYTLHGDIRGRAAFPMASSWQKDHSSLPLAIWPDVTQGELDRAFAESAVLQVEDTTDPNLAPLVARHGLVRIDGANTAADQDARLALGAQLLQTDTPWIQTGDLGPSQPVRVFPGASGGPIVEPGHRLSLGAAPTGGRVFAYRVEAAASTVTWETTVASGSVPDRVGCLRAAAALGTASESSVTFCRTKIPADRSGPGSPTAEELVLEVTTCDAGTCSVASHPSSGPAGGLGDLVSIVVASAASGASCVQPRSATLVAPDGTVAWNDVGAPACVGAPLVYQGIARPTLNDADTVAAYLVGTRRDAGTGEAFVAGADFADVVIEAPGSLPASDTTKLVDTSSP